MKSLLIPLGARHGAHNLRDLLVPHEKGEVHIRALVAYQPPTLGQGQGNVQDPKDAFHFVDVAALCRRKLLRMEHVETKVVPRQKDKEHAIWGSGCRQAYQPACP